MTFDQYSHIIFDFDETLVTLKIHWSFWHQDIIPLIEKYEADFDPQTYLDMSFIHRYVEKYGPNFLKDFVEFEKKLEQEHYYGYIKIEKSLKLLEELERAEKKLFLLTSNCREVVEPILTELKIKDYFQRIVTVNDVENLKPSAAPFKLIREIEIAKEKYLMIGDSKNDSGFAKQAGIAYLDVREF
jgi:HAD superfamily hydrolase (TIGR01549 family)